MAYILTSTQVAKAIFVDPDFDEEILEKYAKQASSYIFNKVGYDFTKDTEIEPLAVLCAELYVRMIHFGAEGYDKDHDYSLGISSLLVDLEVIANGKTEI